MKKVLLIVDDETMVYEVLATQFKHQEIEILTVTDGQDGLKSAFEHHPDLILLDLVMPKMDGMTMLSKLRQDKWGKKARVIILSNVSNDNTVKEAAEWGSDAYLIKADWSVVDVAQKIRDVLGL